MNAANRLSVRESHVRGRVRRRPTRFATFRRMRASKSLPCAYARGMGSRGPEPLLRAGEGSGVDSPALRRGSGKHRSSDLAHHWLVGARSLLSNCRIGQYSCQGWRERRKSGGVEVFLNQLAVARSIALGWPDSARPLNQKGEDHVAGDYDGRCAGYVSFSRRRARRTSGP